MPPKKAAVRVPAKRGKAPPKTKASQPPKKRRLTSSLSTEPIPEYDQDVTIEAQRKRQRFSLSRASLSDSSFDENYLREEFNKLSENSPSRYSWGMQVDEPIHGNTRKTTGGIGRKLRPKSTRDAFDQMMTELAAEINGAPLNIVPNGPLTSHLLKPSLEVREVVYGYPLVHSRSILLKPDWEAIERNPRFKHRHAIVHVCKQLNDEASAFIYRNNVFQAVFRQCNKRKVYYGDYIPLPPTINSKFLCFFRNINMDFAHDCWNTDWLKAATESLEVLVKSNPKIECLTLAVSPKRVGMTTTAAGMERNPVVFADFIWYYSPLMDSIRKLAPKVLKIILKKGDRKRFLIQVDLKYLKATECQQAIFNNVETTKSLSGMEGLVEENLMQLKDRFEAVFDNDALAIADGKCSAIEAAS